jgi:hypothetical protein
MQGFISTRHRRHAGADGVQAAGVDRLVAAYRARQFEVQVITLPDDARANLPDVVLLLRQGREQVLVHAYAGVQGAVPQGAVRQLAIDAFEAGAGRGVLIGAAGFAVSAYQAALHHAQLELVDERGLDALLESSATFQPPGGTSRSPVSRPARSLREATRPAWPVRAAIGMGGMAMAATLVLAASPALQGQLQRMLGRPATASLALAQRDAGAWPAQSRSGELNLGTSAAAAALRQPVDGYVFGRLPANFNQASAPRL